MRVHSFRNLQVSSVQSRLTRSPTAGSDEFGILRPDFRKKIACERSACKLYVNLRRANDLAATFEYKQVLTNQIHSLISRLLLSSSSTYKKNSNASGPGCCVQLAYASGYCRCCNVSGPGVEMEGFNRWMSDPST